MPAYTGRARVTQQILELLRLARAQAGALAVVARKRPIELPAHGEKFALGAASAARLGHFKCQRRRERHASAGRRPPLGARAQYVVATSPSTAVNQLSVGAPSLSA